MLCNIFRRFIYKVIIVESQTSTKTKIYLGNTIRRNIWHNLQRIRSCTSLKTASLLFCWSWVFCFLFFFKHSILWQYKTNISKMLALKMGIGLRFFILEELCCNCSSSLLPFSPGSSLPVKHILLSALNLCMSHTANN